MAPDAERLALHLEIPAIFERSSAEIAQPRDFTIAIRVTLIAFHNSIVRLWLRQSTCTPICIVRLLTSEVM